MAVLAAMAVACAGLHGNKESEKLLLIIIWEKIPPPREPDPG